MKNRDIYWRRYKIQEVLCIEQWCLSPLQSRHLGTSHTSPSVSSTIQNTLQNPSLESPSAALSYFLEYHQWSEISSFSKVIVLGKARNCRAPHLGCRWAKSPGWFDVSPKNSAWDMMHEKAYCCDEATNHQLPIAVAFWIIWIVSAEECSSLMQNLMQIHCSTCSVILNVMATQYTCSLNGI